MKTAAVMARIRAAPPRFQARIAGVFYLSSVLAAVLAEAFVRGRLIYAVGVIPVLCFAAVTLLIYAIFRPVSRIVSLLAALSNLVGLALELLELHLHGINLAMVLHGCYCVLIGYPVFKSAFLPRMLGVLMAVGGLGWLASQSSLLAHDLRVYSTAVGFLGEGSLMLWLLIVGVDVPKWREGRDWAE